MKKRTIYDPNEIVIYDTYAEIIIYDRKGNEKARALIDIEDVDKVKIYKWSLNGRGYVMCRINGKRISLHRFIMNCPENMVVDHINHNKLDNRKCNLRICTQSQNTMNKRKQSNNTSEYTGVYWYKARSKWRVYITVNGKRIDLGYYDNLEEAIKVRKQAEKKYFGEYMNKE